MAGISVRVIIWKRLYLKMANRQPNIIHKVVVRDFKVVKIRDIVQKDHFFSALFIDCVRSLLHHAGSYDCIAPLDSVVVCRLCGFLECGILVPQGSNLGPAL